jgi:hypothetical protein
VVRRLETYPERRHTQRVAPEHTPWRRLAILRPGQEVTLINLSRGGALIESHTRLLPGTRAELQLSGGVRCIVRGRILRCRVSSVNPLRYEGAIVFERTLDWTRSEE